MVKRLVGKIPKQWKETTVKSIYIKGQPGKDQ